MPSGYHGETEKGHLSAYAKEIMGLARAMLRVNWPNGHDIVECFEYAMPRMSWDQSEAAGGGTNRQRIAVAQSRAIVPEVEIANWHATLSPAEGGREEGHDRKRGDKTGTGGDHTSSGARANGSAGTLGLAPSSRTSALCGIRKDVLGFSVIMR